MQKRADVGCSSSFDEKVRQLAHDIEGLVAAGTLRPGERLPSVRETVSRRGVSPSTVFKAYYLLESRGVVEVRPRSGYFVRAPRDAEPEPAAPPPPIGSTPVAVSDLVLEVLGSIRERDIVPMGSAFPSPLLFPLDRLERGGAAAMRRLDPAELLEGGRCLCRAVLRRAPAAMRGPWSA